MDDNKEDEDHGNKENPLLTELKLIGIFGMQDTLRPDVVKAMKLSKKGHIDVCLVSGDHVETAKKYAVKGNILVDKDTKDQVMTLGPYSADGNLIADNSNSIETRLNKITEQSKSIEEGKKKPFPLKVIARSSPHDKLTLT